MTGANRGIGLEAALTLAEAGARTVYCVDLPKEPGEEWTKIRDFVERLGTGKLEYISQDVTDQVSGQLLSIKYGRALTVELTFVGRHVESRRADRSARRPNGRLRRCCRDRYRGRLFGT